MTSNKNIRKELAKAIRQDFNLVFKPFVEKLESDKLDRLLLECDQERGSNILHECTEKGQTAESLRFIIERLDQMGVVGDFLLQENQLHNTPLHEAIYNYMNADAFKVLIETINKHLITPEQIKKLFTESSSKVYSDNYPEKSTPLAVFGAHRLSGTDPVVVRVLMEEYEKHGLLQQCLVPRFYLGGIKNEITKHLDEGTDEKIRQDSNVSYLLAKFAKYANETRFYQRFDFSLFRTVLHELKCPFASVVVLAHCWNNMGIEKNVSVDRPSWKEDEKPQELRADLIEFAQEESSKSFKAVFKLYKDFFGDFPKNQVFRNELTTEMLIIAEQQKGGCCVVQ